MQPRLTHHPVAEQQQYPRAAAFLLQTRFCLPYSALHCDGLVLCCPSICWTTRCRCYKIQINVPPTASPMNPAELLVSCSVSSTGSSSLLLQNTQFSRPACCWPRVISCPSCPCPLVKTRVRSTADRITVLQYQQEVQQLTTFHHEQYLGVQHRIANTGSYANSARATFSQVYLSHLHGTGRSRFTMSNPVSAPWK